MATWIAPDFGISKNWYASGNWEGRPVSDLIFILPELCNAVNELVLICGGGESGWAYRAEAANGWKQDPSTELVGEGTHWLNMWDDVGGYTTGEPLPFGFKVELVKFPTISGTRKPFPRTSDFVGLPSQGLEVKEVVNLLREAIETLLNDGIGGKTRNNIGAVRSKRYCLRFCSSSASLDSPDILSLDEVLAEGSYGDTWLPFETTRDVKVYQQIREALESMNRCLVTFEDGGTFIGTEGYENDIKRYMQNETLMHGEGEQWLSEWEAEVQPTREELDEFAVIMYPRSGKTLGQGIVYLEGEFGSPPTFYEVEAQVSVSGQLQLGASLVFRLPETGISAGANWIMGSHWSAVNSLRNKRPPLLVTAKMAGEIEEYRLYHKLWKSGVPGMGMSVSYQLRGGPAIVGGVSSASISHNAEVVTDWPLLGRENSMTPVAPVEATYHTTTIADENNLIQNNIIHSGVYVNGPMGTEGNPTTWPRGFELSDLESTTPFGIMDISGWKVWPSAS